jgi:hypothetical protein
LCSKRWDGASDREERQQRDIDERRTSSHRTLHPVDPDTIHYELTVDDPKIFTRPWKIAFLITREPGYELFDYTCHQANYSMTNMLSGARAQEKAEAVQQR